MEYWRKNRAKSRIGLLFDESIVWLYYEKVVINSKFTVMEDELNE